MSVFIFSCSKFKTKFETYLKIYSFNSIFVNFYFLIESILVICAPKLILTTYGFIYWTIHLTLSYINITFSFCLDTFIIYERIQILNPRVIFLANKSVYTISMGIIVFSLVTSSFQIMEDISQMLSSNRGILENENIFFYKEITELSESIYFKIVYNIFLFIRLVITLVIDVVLNVMLIVTIRGFYKRRKYTLNMQERYSRNRQENRVALIMCLSTAIFRLLDFMLVFLINTYLKNGPYVRYAVAFGILELLNTLKPAGNFFVFYFLTRKFKLVVKEILKRICPKSS